MDDFRRFPDSNTRQLIDYNRFVSLTGEKVFICLDRGVLEIARYFLNTRGLWRTTYVVDYVGTIGYNMPTVEQFQLVQAAIAEAGVDMSSCEEIAEQLAAIASAIQQSAGTGGCCGSGSRGSGTVAAPANPYNQTETPTEPPPGFESMEQFNSHKCNAALDLLNNLQSDLIGLSGLAYSGSTPTGLVGAMIVFLLTPIPFDDLIALAAYLIYSAYSYTFLAQMAALIEDNESELLCVLYDSPTSESAKTNLLAALETIALAYYATTPDAEWVMGAVEQMLPYDATNKLFEDLPTVAQDADCSACGDDCDACSDGELEIWTDIGNQGTITSTTPGSGEIVYEISSGSYQGGTIDFYISPTADPGDQCNQQITIEILTGTITPAAPAGWRTWNALGELTYSGDVEPPTGYPICVSNVSIRSSTAFTIRVTAQW